MVIGTVFSALAIFALFTSANQAGTAALLLVAAAFLLIGVQGTALSGGLVVANQGSSSSVTDDIATATAQGVVIEVVTWDGPENDRDLGQALNRLLRQAGPSQGGRT